MDALEFGKLLLKGPTGIPKGIVKQIGLGLAEFNIYISIGYVGMLADNWLPFKLMSVTEEKTKAENNKLGSFDLFIDLGESIMPCWKPWGGTYKEGQCKE